MTKKKNKYSLTGTIVSFPKNEISFYQDFRFKKGIPTELEFTVKEDASHDDYWLVADGYGNLDEPNSYGNGMIAVKEKDIRWAVNYHVIQASSAQRPP